MHATKHSFQLPSTPLTHHPFVFSVFLTDNVDLLEIHIKHFQSNELALSSTLPKEDRICLSLWFFKTPYYNSGKRNIFLVKQNNFEFVFTI